MKETLDLDRAAPGADMILTYHAKDFARLDARRPSVGRDADPKSCSRGHGG